MIKTTTLSNLLVVAGFSLFHTPSYAQRNLALYSMAGLEQASHVNPSFIPDASLVIGLPLLSDVNAAFGNNNFALKDLGAKGWSPQGIRLDYEKLLPGLKNENIASGALSANLVTVGFRRKSHYFAFESREHVVGNFFYPRDAIQFGADINNGNYESGLAYNLNGLAYDLTHFRDFSLVYARQVGRASAGVRLRYLIGLENYSTSGPGIALTSTEETNVYQIQGQLDLWAAGVQSLSGDGSYPIWGQGNYGFAFDFGSTYALGEKLTASFSVTNLGGITWSSGVKRRALVKQIEDPRTEIDEIFHRFIYDEPTTTLSYSSALPTFIYLGGAYQMNESNTFNLLFNSRYTQGKHNLALALSYSKIFSSNLRASLTYSAMQGSLLNIGGGIVAGLGPIQVFVVSDNLFSAFSPSGFNNTHLNLGMNLVFSKPLKTEIALADTAALAAPVDTITLAANPENPVPPSTAPDTTKSKETAAQPALPKTAKPAETAQVPPPKTAKPGETAAQVPPPKTAKPEETAAQLPPPKTAKPEETAAQLPPPKTAKPEETAAQLPLPKTAKPEETAAQVPPPKTAKPEETAAQAVTPPASGARKPSTSSIQYVAIQGAILMEGLPGKVDHYYIDVYKILPDGRRELVRTGRVLGGDYKIYLESDYKHEINIRHSESSPLVVRVDKEDLENIGQGTARNITLKKAPPSERTGTANQKPAREEPQSPADDLIIVAAPELQSEATALQKNVQPEEPASPEREELPGSLQLKQDVSIYKDMDVKSRVLARLSTGMHIEILERTSEEWWMVAYRGKVGWVEAGGLK